MPRRMSFAVWSVGLLSLTIASVVPIHAQRGRQAGPPSPVGPGTLTQQQTGVILGRVVDGDTGDPVGGAIVQMVGAPAAPPSPAEAAAGGRGSPPRQQYVIADADGRFVLRDIRPGTYPLSARLAGYLPAQYGQRRPQGPSERLTVGANRPVTEATIRMWRYAAISGVVLEDGGEPAVGVQVRALRVGRAGGRRQLQPVGNAVTDDRGVYRLASLAPGEYYVFTPSTTTSVATSTANWFLEAQRDSGGGSEFTELLNSLRESRAPTPSITGIRVGDQIVSSSSLRSTTSPNVTGNGRLEIYRTTYHPSAQTLERATSIEVTSGEERPGVDLGLVLEPAVSVSGQVIGADGPGVRLGVRLLAADAEEFATEVGMETSVTSTGEDGSFTLLGVPPGQYTIEVLRVPRPERPELTRTTITVGTGMIISSGISSAGPQPEAPSEPTLWAEQAIAVGETDIDGIALRLREGMRVSGRVEFEGTAPPPDGSALERIGVSLTPASGQRLAATTTTVRVEADGTFETGGYPPGRYFLNASPPSTPGARWILKSAQSGGRDIVHQAVELDIDDVRGVVVTFTDKASALTGSVQLPAGEEDEALVAVFPADYRAWIADGMSNRSARSTRTGSQGQFSLPGLRPGDYLAVAVPAGTELDLQDPELIARLARGAISVQVPDGGSASVRLSVTVVR